MIRRPSSAAAFLIAALLATGVLAACNKYQPNEAAATVNGHELSLDQLDELTEGNDDPAIRRATLSAWIQVVAASEQPGEFLSEEALAAQRDVIIPPLIEATQPQTQEQYELGLQGSPLLCLAVIPLAAEVAAADVLDALAAGAPFAELAAEFSDDPDLGANGGIIDVNGQECLPTDQWNPDLISALSDTSAQVGKPDVINLNDSEVVVLLRPFAELNEGSKAQLAQGPVSEALLALYRAADVTVNESIGEWDSEQGIVVASSSDE